MMERWYRNLNVVSLWSSIWQSKDRTTEENATHIQLTYRYCLKEKNMENFMKYICTT